MTRPFRPSPDAVLALALAAAAPVHHFLPFAAAPQDPPSATAPAQGDAKQKETPPAAAEKEKKVREVLALLGTVKIAEKTMEQMLDAFRAMPNLPDGFLEKFAQLAKAEDIVELTIPLYVKHVETNDLDAALAFFRTESGRRWAAAQLPIQTESVKLGQEWGQKVARRALQELQGK